MSRQEDAKLLFDLFLEDVDDLAERLAHTTEAEARVILTDHCRDVHLTVCERLELLRGELDYAPLT